MFVSICLCWAGWKLGGLIVGGQGLISHPSSCPLPGPQLGIHRPLTEPEVENWRMLVVVAAMMSTSQAQGLVWTETPGSPL